MSFWKAGLDLHNVQLLLSNQQIYLDLDGLAPFRSTLLRGILFNRLTLIAWKILMTWYLLPCCSLLSVWLPFEFVALGCNFILAKLHSILSSPSMIFPFSIFFIQVQHFYLLFGACFFLTIHFLIFLPKFHVITSRHLPRRLCSLSLTLCILTQNLFLRLFQFLFDSQIIFSVHQLHWRFFSQTEAFPILDFYLVNIKFISEKVQFPSEWRSLYFFYTYKWESCLQGFNLVGYLIEQLKLRQWFVFLIFLRFLGRLLLTLFPFNFWYSKQFYTFQFFACMSLI